jgi:hypothetical protein
VTRRPGLSGCFRKWWQAYNAPPGSTFDCYAPPPVRCPSHFQSGCSWASRKRAIRTAPRITSAWPHHSASIRRSNAWAAVARRSNQRSAACRSIRFSSATIWLDVKQD